MYLTNPFFRLAVALLVTITNTAYASSCSAKSGSQITPLLELYTSEGCSSCPSADAWISSLNTTNVIPLAFHVDYWDYIGWKDRFAKPQFSARQHTSAQHNGATYVYTPQFLLNGRDFRGGSEGRLQQAVQVEQKHRPHVTLALDAWADKADTWKLSASATEIDKAGGTQIFIALYENHLSSRVQAGENSGRELKHDYVVRELYGPFEIPSSGQFNQQLTLSNEWLKKIGGTVIFAQNAKGEILQTLKLPFCNPLN